LSSVEWGVSIGWDGGELAVGAADQSPAAFMDRPMMGPAQQDQVVQVGGAAMQPVPQMMGLTPGQGPVAGGEDTAAVTHGQGDPLAGLDDPAGPPHLQRLGRGTTQHRGEPLGRGPELLGQASWAVGVVVAMAAGMVAAVVATEVVLALVVLEVVVAVVVIEVVVAVVAGGVVEGDGGVGGLAGDQDPGHRPVAGQPPTPLRGQRPQLGVAAQPGVALEAVQVDQHRQLRAHPPVWGSRPASRARRASSARASARR
jgi:hypothetical protein